MKASALLGAGWEDDSLDVLWRDAGRAFCSLRRKDAATETHAFIPIPSGAEHPTLESVNRLTHEHGLQRYLDGSWALRPIELVRERGQTMLVVDYPGGEPLDRLVREPMEPPPVQPLRNFTPKPRSLATTTATLFFTFLDDVRHQYPATVPEFAWPFFERHPRP